MFVPSLPNKFSISKLSPIGSNAIRVFFDSEGSFSFIWRSIGESFGRILLKLFILGRVGDQKSIFIGARTAILFLGQRGVVLDDLVRSSADFGSIQLITYQQSARIKNAFLRIYNFFNHVNSKVFQEYFIGPVTVCQSISYFSLKAGVTITCGARLFHIKFELNPYLELTSYGRNRTLNIHLEGENLASRSSIMLRVESTSLDYTLSKWFILLIFLSIVIITILVIKLFWKFPYHKLLCPKKKKKVQRLQRKVTDMMTAGRRGVYRKVVDGEDSYNILVSTDKVKDKPFALLQDFHHKENNSMVERQDINKLFSTDINASLINEESANSMSKFSNTEISESLPPQNSHLVSN